MLKVLQTEERLQPIISQGGTRGSKGVSGTQRWRHQDDSLVVWSTLVSAAAAYKCKVISIPINKWLSDNNKISTLKFVDMDRHKKKKSPFKTTVGVLTLFEIIVGILMQTWSLIRPLTSAQCFCCWIESHTEVHHLMIFLLYRYKWMSQGEYLRKHHTNNFYFFVSSCQEDIWTCPQNSMKNIFLMWRFISFSIAQPL